jgi:site-specific DNA recombinase
MRLFAYTRVSTAEQCDGHSLDQQRGRLNAYCIAHDHELVGVIEDGDESGGVPLEKRPGGAQMMRLLRAGEADGFVVIRLERVFRDLLDGLYFFRETARRLSITVHSLAEHIDTSTAAGRLALNVHLMLADHERDKGSERTTEVMRGLRLDGRVYGTTPYGCVARAGRLYRDPAAWATRESIIALREQGSSFDTIRHHLHDREIAAPAGGRWWGKSTLRGLVETHGDLVHLPLLSESVDDEA